MILELRKEERWVDVRMAVVNLCVVCLGTTCCAERRHSMRAGVLAQGSQRWGVGAQIWTSYTYSQGSLRANHCRCTTHGRQEEGVGDGVSEAGVEMVCLSKVSMWV